MPAFQYDPERGRFRDWLGTVVRRRVNRFLAKKSAATFGAGGEEAAAAEAGAQWTTEFNAQILRVALDRVRPLFGAKTWQAFASVWLENQSTADTAAKLEMTFRAVYVAKSKVLKRLEQEVLDLAEDIPLAPPS
jgi:RNA polymerase sigma-70 factor (ECF subfamily)